MKNYKNPNGEIYPFDSNCFDEKGTCINEWALNTIEENNLTPMTEEEYNTYLAEKEAERLAEEERLAKIPSEDEALNAKIELALINLLEQGGMI